MGALPKVRPVSDMRVRLEDVLAEVNQGPVILARHGNAAAVLVSLEAWNALIAELEDLEDSLAMLEGESDPGPNISLDDLIAERERAGSGVSN
jgi:prevent-host-death family protein